MIASRVAQATAASDATDPSPQANIPCFLVFSDISHSLLWNRVRGCWRLSRTIGQLDLQMMNRSVIQWLTVPAEIEQDHKHEMILAQNVGYKAPNSMSSSDPGQMFEQGCSHAKRMIFVGNHYRDFSNSRFVTDDYVVRYTDQPIGVECAESAPPMYRLDQLANEFVKLDRLHRKESIVAVIIAQVLMECHHGLGVVGAEAMQRHEPSVEQLSCSREFR